MTYFSLKNICIEKIVYRGIGGKGVGESILEAYNEYLESQNTTIVLKTNGIIITIERDLHA